MCIKNRYEFLYYVECINGNPNGDPDAGNAPRIDPQDMHGLISDVAIKRRIRNYVQLAKNNVDNYGIIVQQSSNINKYIAKAHQEINSTGKSGEKNNVENARKWCCQNFYDVRTFGGVLSTGKNAGQIRGPVQLTFLRSVEPVLPLDISITRVQVAENVKGAETYEAYLEWEAKQEESKLRTMGRKQLIPYGLYEGRGFISANLAKDTGFSEVDLNLFWEALLNMYEHDRSASKGQMSTILPVIIFKHVGTDSNEQQRENQAKLGCAPAHKLFELVKLEKNDKNSLSRSYSDYTLRIAASKLPKGVEIGFAFPQSSIASISWGVVPDDLKWVVLE